MKLMFTFLLLIAEVVSISAQEIHKVEFCNCIDKVDQVSPVLNGRYERTCNGKVNETGVFKDGNKDGEWTTFSSKGGVIKKINYANGKLSGKAELFYIDGKAKLKASFVEGKPDDEWIYYSNKGKVLVQGKYENGKPVNIWSVYNGSKVAVQYDFAASEYLKRDIPQLRKSGSFMRNDNSGEYFFFYFSTVAMVGETAPLGGQQFAISLLQDLYEIPLDYWDTYITYEYLATVSISADHQSTFSLNRFDGEYDLKDEITYPFLVKTNPDSKIKKVDHTDLSRKLLDFKINETFSFLPPWIFAGAPEVRVHLPYVINRLVDFSKPEERKYN